MSNTTVIMQNLSEVNYELIYNRFSSRYRIRINDCRDWPIDVHGVFRLAIELWWSRFYPHLIYFTFSF